MTQAPRCPTPTAARFTLLRSPASPIRASPTIASTPQPCALRRGLLFSPAGIAIASKAGRSPNSPMTGMVTPERCPRAALWSPRFSRTTATAQPPSANGTTPQPWRPPPRAPSNAGPPATVSSTSTASWPGKPRSTSLALCATPPSSTTPHIRRPRLLSSLRRSRRRCH